MHDNTSANFCINAASSHRLGTKPHDFDGNFSIKAAKGNTLVFSYIGYSTTEIKVENDQPMRIVLKEDSKVLDEVVVTALGIMRKGSSLRKSKVTTS